MSDHRDKSTQPPRSFRNLLRTILMLDDTPHSIALGTAIGMFVGMTPTVGVQMLIVLGIAFLTRPFFHFNRVAGVLTVYVTNPLTIVPVYWFNYCVGTLFVEQRVSYEHFAAILQYEGFEQWWVTVSRLLSEVGLPLLTGSLIVAVICSLATYPAMIWLISRVRHRHASRECASVLSPQSDTDLKGDDQPEATTQPEPEEVGACHH